MQVPDFLIACPQFIGEFEYAPSEDLNLLFSLFSFQSLCIQVVEISDVLVQDVLLLLRKQLVVSSKLLHFPNAVSVEYR